jgi:ribosomal protein L7/L12
MTTPMDFVKVGDTMIRRDAITMVGIDYGKNVGDDVWTLIVSAGPVVQRVSQHTSFEEAEVARNELFLRVTLITPEDSIPSAPVWELWLERPGDKIIMLIKEVRCITTLGLKEAKDLVDSSSPITGRPQLIKTFGSQPEAEAARRLIEGVGAQAGVIKR